MIRSTEDLKPKPVAKLKWRPGMNEREAALDAVYAHVTQHATRAIDWYLEKRVWKKRWALILRFGAIVIAAVAGVIPMLSQIFVDEQDVPAIAPVWATVVLAGAGLLVLLDRFAGYSSAWMRFIEAEQRIRIALHEFQIDWERRRAGWEEEQPTSKQAQESLDRCKEFILLVDGIVLEDTKKWIAEFSSTISQIDAMVKVRKMVEERRAGENAESQEGSGTEATRTEAAKASDKPKRSRRRPS